MKLRAFLFWRLSTFIVTRTSARRRLRILHSIPTVLEKKKKKNTTKQTNRRAGRKRGKMSIIVIPDVIVDRVGYWYKGNIKKQVNKNWRFGWHRQLTAMSMLGTVIIRSNLVTGNSADNSWNYHEEFACSRRCHVLNSLLIVFYRVSGANEREARAVHITVKLPPSIISNSNFGRGNNIKIAYVR